MPEVARLVADSGPALVLTSPALADTARAAAGAVPVVDDLAALEADEPAPIVPRDDDDLAALVYTGGTTGRAKGVMLTHANLWEAGRHGHEVGHVDGIDRSLTCLPLAHSYGLLVLGVGLHHPGRPVSALMRWFEPRGWLELVAEHRVQIAAVVPSMLHLLLREPLEEYDLSSLRYVASGAAPLALDAIEELRRRIPGVEIREGYGLTETSALVSTNPPGAIRPGTVGPPVPGTEVRLVDGEVCVRSDLVMAGYWNAPELTAETIRDGWLSHGRHGPARRRGLPDDRRPQEGPDHPRRLQRLPARRRGGALRAPGASRRRASSAGPIPSTARRWSRSSPSAATSARRSSSPSAASASAGTSTRVRSTSSTRSR